MLRSIRREEHDRQTRERSSMVPVIVTYDIVIFYITGDQERGSPGSKAHTHMCVLVDPGMFLHDCSKR